LDGFGDEEDEEGELEDDFILKANEGDDESSGDEEAMNADRVTDMDASEVMKRFGLIRNQRRSCDSDEDEDDAEEEADLDQSDYDEEVYEKRSRHTTHSMTSAVIKRNEGTRENNMLITTFTVHHALTFQPFK